MSKALSLVEGAVESSGAIEVSFDGEGAIGVVGDVFSSMLKWLCRGRLAMSVARALALLRALSLVLG